MSRYRLLGLGVLLVAAVAIAQLPVREAWLGWFAWVGSLGPWGPIVLAAAYVPASVLMVPASLLTLGAGFTFGLVPATIAVSIGSTTGAAVAFLIGRSLLREPIERWAHRHPRFWALDQAVGRQGLKIIFLARLSPILPFSLLNYAFAATRARFRDFVLASWLGMLPGTVMYVYLGSAASELARLFTVGPERDGPTTVLFVIGLLATVVVTVVVVRLARQALAEAMDEAPTGPDLGEAA